LAVCSARSSRRFATPRRFDDVRAYVDIDPRATEQIKSDWEQWAAK
jgi:hypothetical protein